MFRELSLVPDGGQYRFLPFLKLLQVVCPLLKFPQDSVRQVPVGLLPVPGDEGDGVSLLQEPQDCCRLPDFYPKLPADDLCDLQSCCFSSFSSGRP